MPCFDADQTMDMRAPLRPQSHIALDLDALHT